MLIKADRYEYPGIEVWVEGGEFLVSRKGASHRLVGRGKTAEEAVNDLNSMTDIKEEAVYEVCRYV